MRVAVCRGDRRKQATVLESREGVAGKHSVRGDRVDAPGACLAIRARGVERDVPVRIMSS